MDRKAGYLHKDKIFHNIHRFSIPHGTEYTECQACGEGGVWGDEGTRTQALYVHYNPSTPHGNRLLDL